MAEAGGTESKPGQIGEAGRIAHLGAVPALVSALECDWNTVHSPARLPRDHSMPRSSAPAPGPKSPPRTLPAGGPGSVLPPVRAKRRLPPDERRQLIIDGAAQYFAEVGFDGQTRELSDRLGITNALLFRYFPTKEDLIEQVYQRVFVERWQPGWEGLIKDRSRTLNNRLNEYYRSYLSVAYGYTWLRIFFFASLRGISIKDRYLELVEQKVIQSICAEVRHQLGMPSFAEVPVTTTERDAVWCLHGEVIYVAIRRFIYNQPIEDPHAIVETAIAVFLKGIGPVVKAAVAKAAATVAACPAD